MHFLQDHQGYVVVHFNSGHGRASGTILILGDIPSFKLVETDLSYVSFLSVFNYHIYVTAGPYTMQVFVP